MLVLSRRVGEEILIGENIRLTVVAVHGNQVRLGFQAPECVTILREEVLHKPGHARSSEPCTAGR
jgi:carbon storage regulator